MDYQVKNADLIDSLPTNQTELPPADVQIINTIFKQQSSDIGKILYEFKDAFIIALLVILFSNPKIDELIQRFIPFTETSYIALISIKVLIATLCIWALKTWLSSGR